jgi:phage baseplate assembly protein W
MADLALVFGGDLSAGPTGDVLLADGTGLTQQRVLRRLLTNAGHYIWQLRYGAGLAQFVGRPGAPAVIAGVVRTQMLLEAAIAATPAPAVSARSAVDGSVNLTVQYADAQGGGTDILSFSV